MQLIQLPKENLKNLGLPGFKPWLALQYWCSTLTNWASKPAGIIALCNYVKILLKRFHFNGQTIRFPTDSKVRRISQDSKYSLWLWNCYKVMMVHCNIWQQKDYFYFLIPVSVYIVYIVYKRRLTLFVTNLTWHSFTFQKACSIRL